ncbi:MAG: transketolase C-terminal domain-containing protein, partial [Pseudomonadota bacterium]
RVVVFMEPIALYPQRDLFDDADGQWMRTYPKEGRARVDEVSVRGYGNDVAVVTYGNGVLLSKKARKDVEATGLSMRIVDLRWLKPLPLRSLLTALEGVSRVLVVDECRRTGNLSEEIVTALTEAGWAADRVSRLTADDSFIATGPAYAATLPSAVSIAQAVTAFSRP